MTARFWSEFVGGLLKLYRGGRRPPQVTDDPVAWMARCHNKVADGLADLTMDKALSWERLYETTAEPSQANWIIQTDGGRRSDHCAAASLVIGVLSTGARGICYEPWFARGVYLTGNVSVFQAEAIALEEAVNWLIRRTDISSTK